MEGIKTASTGLVTEPKKPIPKKDYKPTRKIEWTKPPEEPIFNIEWSGVWDIGKTHACLTFPNPAIADTEGKAWIVCKKLGIDKWFRVESFDDIRQFILNCLKDDAIKTVVVDSGSDLQDLAAQEFLAESGQQKIFPVVLWARVYEKIDELVQLIKRHNKYFTTTSRLKEEFAKDTRTGRLIRSGYRKFPYQLEMLIRLEYGITVEEKGEDKTYFKDRVFGRVIKNNFWKYGCKEKKPWLFDISFAGIEKELLEPWDGGDIIKQAERFVLKEASSTPKSKKETTSK